MKLLVQNCVHIVFLVDELLMNETNFDESIIPIEDKDARISIPREVLESAEREAQVRMASFLFRNMSGLLPESLDNGVEMEKSVHNNIMLKSWCYTINHNV